MTQRSGINLFWRAFAVLLLIVVIGGCKQSAPPSAPTSAAAPANADRHEVAPDEPASTVAEAEVDPPSEVVPTPSTATEAEEAAVDEQPMKKEPPKSQPKPVAPPSTPTPGKAPKVALSVPELPEYVFEPQVLMSQQHMDTCLVKVGEPFPMAEISDLDGKEHSLKELLGEKLTVVVFWSNANRLGREQIQRLEREIVTPFHNTGLSVVAINFSDTAEQVRDSLPTSQEDGFKVLLDTEAGLYSQIATKHHPRTYLIDAEGAILWLDIEYSRSMMRELSNAINVHLRNIKFGES